MSFSSRRSSRTSSASFLASKSLTSSLGAAVVAGAVLIAPATSSHQLGPVDLVASCTPHSSGLAKGVSVKVTKVRAVSVKRLESFKGTAKVRVKLAVTGTGTATGYGYADACPGGVSNPQEIERIVTWTGTKTVRMDYTASGRTTKQATRIAARKAKNLCRAAAVQDINEATTRKTEATARDLAVAASSTPPPTPTGSNPTGP